MRDNPINALRETLRCGFAFRKSRLESLCVLVFGVFVARTVNLSHLACHFPGRARSSSNYRRLQRFFEQVDFDYDRLAEFLVAMMGLQAGPWRRPCPPTGGWVAATSTSRHDRHRQPRHRHSRVLAGARQGGQFQYQGADRDPRTRPPALRGRQDRQPPGRPGIHRRRLAGMVAGKAIPFHIRIRSNIKIANTRGCMVKARELFRDLKPGESRILSNARRLSEARKPKARPVFVTALHLKTGELLIVVTNDAPEEALAIYAQRWQIETLFAALKTRGFNLEDTHMTDPERISKLTAVLSITFCCRRLAPRGRADPPQNPQKDGKIHLPIRFRVDKATARQSYRQASSH